MYTTIITVYNSITCQFQDVHKHKHDVRILLTIVHIVSVKPLLHTIWEPMFRKFQTLIPFLLNFFSRILNQLNFSVTIFE